MIFINPHKCCTFVTEKSCLTSNANLCIIQKLKLLPSHYLYWGETLVNRSFLAIRHILAEFFGKKQLFLHFLGDNTNVNLGKVKKDREYKCFNPKLLPMWILMAFSAMSMLGKLFAKQKGLFWKASTRSWWKKSRSYDNATQKIAAQHAWLW